jgi:hypothetical protein
MGLDECEDKTPAILERSSRWKRGESARSRGGRGGDDGVTSMSLARGRGGTLGHSGGTLGGTLGVGSTASHC